MATPSVLAVAPYGETSYGTGLQGRNRTQTNSLLLNGIGDDDRQPGLLRLH
ncbi:MULTISPECIES: hypothetical protein [Arthrobacter]|uniref:hypothetical protein n=1 Tax=Arthrobacter TaxID=1663 RepID=UPI0014727D45|nr:MULTISPECIES: hypothetical protein [Arthrobacter]NYG18978.1 hypothetical protein [Arthrobacter psychrochitiniphilus]